MVAALVLQHAPHIGLGNLADTLAEHGIAFDVVDVPGGRLAEFDPVSAPLAIVLGGTESAYRTDRYPYLADEIAWLQARTSQHRPTLGICLGAQLLAPALGGTARRGKYHEVGFVTVGLTEDGASSPLRHIAAVPMLEWHHDTFDLPPGAELLAATEHYPQAYRIQDWLLAVQFHPEADQTITADWIERWADEIENGLSAAELGAEATTRLTAAQAASRAMIGEWLAGLGAERFDNETEIRFSPTV